MIYELEGYDTETRDARWRVYTRSKRERDLWLRIPRLQFVGSGHGVVFRAREMPRGEKPKPTRRPGYDDWPSREMQRIQSMERTAKALSKAQRGLLREMVDSRYGELSLRGPALQTGRALEEKGLIEPVGYGMRTYGITDEGRATLQEAER